jgi:transketolase
MVAEAIEAGEKLAAEGIDARIINIHTIKPLDEELIVKAAQETGKIITIEEHSVIGGLGSAVCDVVTAKCPVPVVKMGVQDVFGFSGPGGDMITEFGLRAANIVAEAKKMLNK